MDANGFSSRAAMIFAAVTGPIPGSASSSAIVARLRSTGRGEVPEVPDDGPFPVDDEPPLPPRPAGSSRDGTTT